MKKLENIANYFIQNLHAPFIALKNMNLKINIYHLVSILKKNYASLVCAALHNNSTTFSSLKFLW